MSLKGFVTNTSEGVAITVEGDSLDVFVERIRSDAPPLSKIMSVEISPVNTGNFKDFFIKESSDTGSFTLVSNDISICKDCLCELFDEKDRRYLYPFINCTNCGPRYSIIKSIPYDREHTTMNVFEMCADCEAEYHDPVDRRFHAQPNACPRCGPQVKLRIMSPESGITDNADPFKSTIDMLKNGNIVAIKGLGGFHIACDAVNAVSIGRLREGKRRSNKPFALMAPDIASVKKFCHVSEKEEALILSPHRPIVLLRKREHSLLPDAVSPGNKFYGFMLPYTPLHYMLFYAHLTPNEPSALPQFSALVMTSGNLSEEPVLIDNDAAEAKLQGIVDAFLFHNRDIFMRVDDSVLHFRSLDAYNLNADETSFPSSHLSQPCFIRRSRGYVPQPIPLSDDGPDVLGVGADLKNTFTLTKGSYAIPSQHIGDMENYETLAFFEETLNNLKSVYRAEPVVMAYDLHPRYLSTQWALKQTHHYAHVASVMAEKGIKEKVIGVSFDGNGYGEDGTLWGGEFLLADLKGFARAAHINCVPLPGGETAIREPWRTAVSYIKEATGDEVWSYIEHTGILEKFGKDTVEKVLQIRENSSFSPLSSGAGRLFDAVSALAGICYVNTFEGEAAMALESFASEDIFVDYPVDISFKDPMIIDFSQAILYIIEDIRNKAGLQVISSKFHNSVVSMILRIVMKIALTYNIHVAVLSGGVFQNLYLLNRVIDGLTAEGIDVFTNELVPCNDAGISLGQAFIIRERFKSGQL
jgi:hydrogenase maturation protein HypF